MTDSPRLGSRLAWIRDLFLVGAAASAAPAVVVYDMFPDFVVGAAVAGPLTGALLGLVLRPLLLGPFSRVPFAALILIGGVIGAAWGASVGALAAEAAALIGPPPTPSDFADPPVWLGAVVGAIAGAIQLGWFFVPYTLQRARAGRAWPVVLAACVVSPALGIAAILLFSLVT